MRDITLEELLQAGCHFGHQVNRRNPKADDFIFEERAGVHIIDLAKTRSGLLSAAEFLKNISKEGGYLVIIGTKRQAKGIVEEEVERAQKEGAGGLFYTTSRWVGGTLTNFSEVSKNFKRLEELNTILATQRDQGYTKRELLLFERERQNLLRLYGGISTLDRAPDALFIIDTHLERTAVAEAAKIHIKTVGITDTNANPYEMDYSIPANDDAVGSIKIITSYIIDAWIEGHKERKKEEVKGENLEEREKKKAVKE